MYLPASRHFALWLNSSDPLMKTILGGSLVVRTELSVAYVLLLQGISCCRLLLALTTHKPPTSPSRKKKSPVMAAVPDKMLINIFYRGGLNNDQYDVGLCRWYFGILVKNM